MTLHLFIRDSHRDVAVYAQTVIDYSAAAMDTVQDFSRFVYKLSGVAKQLETSLYDFLTLAWDVLDLFTTCSTKYKGFQS